MGNSHTFTNDLPGEFFELAAAAGHDIEVYDLTEGSYTLKRYSDKEDELGGLLMQALEEEEWEFVILQENTNAAIMDTENEMYPYARILDEQIKKANGQTAFLMTWSPKEGAGILSKEKIQSKLSQSYISIAKELDALLIPGGDLFMAALEQYPDVELWDEDGQHPSVEGTYLAACGTYALFFQQTPKGNPYQNDLSAETAEQLQAVAGDYVLGK